MQHVVEADDAAFVQQRMDERELLGEVVALVLAVDVHETQALPASLARNSGGVSVRLSAFHER